KVLGPAGGSLQLQDSVFDSVKDRFTQMCFPLVELYDILNDAIAQLVGHESGGTGQIVAHLVDGSNQVGEAPVLEIIQAGLQVVEPLLQFRLRRRQRIAKPRFQSVLEVLLDRVRQRLPWIVDARQLANDAGDGSAGLARERGQRADRVRDRLRQG